MKKTDVYLICILLLALAGGCLILRSTRWGLGVSPDSVNYIQAARNLASGFGLTLWSEAGYTAMTHFPPLYSLVLAAILISHIDILTGARWLQVVIFSANIASIGMIIWLSAPGARWLGMLAAGLALAALPMLQIHSWALSEPLFIFLGIWSSFILYWHLVKPSWILLLGSAALVGLAWLTRYVGFSLMLAGGISILLFSREGVRFRLLDCFTFCLISAIPIAIWLARNALTAGDSVNRTIALHPVSMAKIKSLAVVATSWLIPQLQAQSIRPLLAIATVVVLIIAISHLWYPVLRRQRIQPILFILIFITSYIFTLLISISFLDNAIPIDNRILSPVFVAGMLLIGCIIGMYAIPRGFNPKQVIAILVGFIIIAGIYTPPATGWLKALQEQGLGYASPLWTESRIIDRLNQLPTTTPIYSNAPDPIYLLTGLHAMRLPNIYNQNSLIGNSDYQEDMRIMGSVLRDEKGVLVIFKTVTRHPYLATEEDILTEYPLKPLYVEDDGTIYTWKDGS